MLFPTSNISLQTLTGSLFEEKGVSISIVRLDEIHPVVSGNKLFKLHYFLENALRQPCEGIVTFGGAYSNHLVATAYACKINSIPSIGIVRGEASPTLSHTLKACMDYGMKLQFVTRHQFDTREEAGFLSAINPALKNYIIIPEGGYHPLGAAGASLIMDMVPPGTSHICCAAGTATTAAGLLMGLKSNQQLMIVPVLKNLHDLEARIQFLTNHAITLQALTILPDYHFGGYAKKKPELISFMNELYQKHTLPTDFVYTAKMMFGVIDCIRNDIFTRGSNIVCIHTGGLQGNLSLQPATLVF